MSKELTKDSTKETSVEKKSIILENGMEITSVTVSTGVTVSMGNYQSLKQEMRITVNGHESHTLDEVVDYISDYIDVRLLDTVKTAQKNLQELYNGGK